MEMVSDVGIQEIVAHIASHCEHFSRGAFSTASTITMTGCWLAGEAHWPTVRVIVGLGHFLRSSSTGLAREFEVVAG